MKAEYFESAEVSDLGKKRTNNEDACLRIPDKGVFCVADGMGGQLGGDLASETITTTLQEVFAKAAPGEDDTLSHRIALLRKAANQASRWIKNYSDEKVIGQMGSTLVALVFDPRNPARAVGLHAGDSRLYRYRNGGLSLLTADHSAVAALAAKLGRDPASLPAKYQNELLRAVGLSETVELEKTHVDVQSGDVFLLCSDGLTRMVPDDVIVPILKQEMQAGIGAAAQALVNAANEAGGKDNVTVVLVKLGDISGVPNIIDPDDEEESKPVAAPVPSQESDTPTPANPPGDRSKTPDTADEDQGHTPHTDDSTPEKAPNADETPKISPGVSDRKTKTTVGKAAGSKNMPWAGIAIVAAVIIVGAGIFFIAGSKPRPKPAVAAPIKPPPPASPNKTDAQAQAKIQQAAAYRDAIKKAQDAYNSHNYAGAGAWAAGALQIMPGDAAATQLQDGAQRAINEYQEDMRQAQAAWQRGDYPAVIAVADKALAIYTSDENAQKLKADALAQIKVREAYDAAMKNAKIAYDNHDYINAMAWAASALQKIPGDPAAAQLQAEAQRQGTAQFQQTSDLESARKSYAQGDYEAVAKLCGAHPDIEAFAQLAQSGRAEQMAFADATALLGRGDYSFIEKLQGQAYGQKPPFAGLCNQAAGERKTLADLEALKRANNWQAVAGKLSAPAAEGFTNKPPFIALAQWAKACADQAATQAKLAQLNVSFEEMLVWFNIKKPTDPYIKTPEARKEQRKDGELGNQKDNYLNRITWLENEYKNGGWLNQDDRAKYLKELRDTIAHHD
jgi:protein phosphatase